VVGCCAASVFAGHTCFVAGGGPWCGATVKLDVTLKAPVSIGDTLLVTGKVVEKVSTRGGKFKVKIEATLQDGDASSNGAAPVVYAEMTGVSIEGVRLPSQVPHDAIDDRSWESGTCAAADGISSVGDTHYQDTGWNL
jgi:acyl-CoA hydrolase